MNADLDVGKDLDGFEPTALEASALTTTETKLIFVYLMCENNIDTRVRVLCVMSGNVLSRT